MLQKDKIWLPIFESGLDAAAGDYSILRKDYYDHLHPSEHVVYGLPLPQPVSL